MTMTLTLLDGLRRTEAETAVRRIRREENTLRTAGGKGNYSQVRYVESYRRGHTLDDRDDIVRYKVVVEIISNHTF
jgi:hypothetical protein